MPLWFKIVIGFAVIALIAVTWGILFTERLVEIVDDQLASLRHEDITTAYYGYTSKGFQETYSLEQFREFLNAHPGLLKNEFSHFGKRGLVKHVGILTGTVTCANHAVIPMEYQLIKEDGAWKISSMRSLDNKDNDLSYPHITDRK